MLLSSARREGGPREVVASGPADRGCGASTHDRESQPRRGLPNFAQGGGDPIVATDLNRLMHNAVVFNMKPGSALR
jgi:hypothetical protein